MQKVKKLFGTVYLEKSRLCIVAEANRRQNFGYVFSEKSLQIPNF
jgi:hypothetical protein